MIMQRFLINCSCLGLYVSRCAEKIQNVTIKLSRLPETMQSHMTSSSHICHNVYLTKVLHRNFRFSLMFRIHSASTSLHNSHKYTKRYSVNRSSFDRLLLAGLFSSCRLCHHVHACLAPKTALAPIPIHTKRPTESNAQSCSSPSAHQAMVGADSM